jgi:hypothetical protein
MLPGSTITDEPSVTGLATDLTRALRKHLGTPVQAAVAGAAAGADGIPAVKLRGWKTLGLIADDTQRLVATASELGTTLALGEMLTLLAEREDVRDPGVATLVRHDAEHGTELARSLLMYLDGFGDVAEVAAALHVHPNTLRHRIRRAADVAGIDLTNADHRLVATIQLRLAADAADTPAAPFPASPSVRADIPGSRLLSGRTILRNPPHPYGFASLIVDRGQPWPTPSGRNHAQARTHNPRGRRSRRPGGLRISRHTLRRLHHFERLRPHHPDNRLRRTADRRRVRGRPRPRVFGGGGHSERQQRERRPRREIQARPA